MSRSPEGCLLSVDLLLSISPAPLQHLGSNLLVLIILADRRIVPGLRIGWHRTEIRLRFDKAVPMHRLRILVLLAD